MYLSGGGGLNTSNTFIHINNFIRFLLLLVLVNVTDIDCLFPCLTLGTFPLPAAAGLLLKILNRALKLNPQFTLNTILRTHIAAGLLAVKVCFRIV